MTANRTHPGPGQWECTAAIGDRHHQQLMPKTNFASIHDQVHHTAGQALQNPTRDRLVPGARLNGRIVQQAAQPPGSARQTTQPGHLRRNFAQVHCLCRIHSNQQPGEVAQPSHPLAGAQLCQFRHPDVIKFPLRHGAALRSCCGNRYFSRRRAAFSNCPVASIVNQNGPFQN